MIFETFFARVRMKSISNSTRNRFLIILFMAVCAPATASPNVQYYKCKYLDGVYAEQGTGKIKQGDSSISAYIDAEFSINRDTGLIVFKKRGHASAETLFPPGQPDVAKANEPQLDNYQLIWRDRYATGYEQHTFLSIRTGFGGSGPFPFVHITTTDKFLTGLCYLTPEP